MTREAFLERLEYLLKDISEQERKDALDYYNAYMDDAGLLAADEVEGFLESPEVIAASIRNSLNGKEDMGEFSENGYREPGQGDRDSMSKPVRLSKGSGEKEEKYAGSTGSQNAHEEGSEYHYSYGTEREWQPAGKTGEDSDMYGHERSVNMGKVLLIIGLCIIGLPVIGSVIAGAGSLVLGIFAGIVGIIIGVGFASFGLILFGICLFVTGVFQMFTSIPTGILLMGIGLLLVAAGLLAMIVTLWLFRLIPRFCKWIADLFHRAFRRGGKAA